MKRSIPEPALLPFFALTFIISWGIWASLIFSGKDSQILFWLAGFGPSLSAIMISVHQNGFGGLRALLKLRWRIAPHWYAISLLGTPVVMLVALGLHMLFGGETPRYLDPNHMVTSPGQWPLVFVVFLYVFVFTSLGEEIGWRGFALPQLQKRFTPFGASMILGVIWAGWHLPLFRLDGNFHQQLPFSWFFLQVLGINFLYTWLFNRTGGSLAPVLIFHASSNAAVGLLPVLPLDNSGSLRPLWLTVFILWVFVGLALWFDRRLFFSSSENASESRPGAPSFLR